MAKINYNEPEIAALVSAIVAFCAERPEDMAIKVAALRTAAELHQQAVSQAAMSASLMNILNSNKTH